MMNTTGVKGHVIAKAFAGHKDFMNKILVYAGDPDSNTVTADFAGQICWDSLNDDVYINNTDSTTWTKINY